MSRGRGVEENSRHKADFLAGEIRRGGPSFHRLSHYHRLKGNRIENRTDPCQLCKTLTGQILLLPCYVVFVWSGKGFANEFDHRGAINYHFGILRPFWHGVEPTNKRTLKQPGDPRASLLLTSEKAVFCNKLPDQQCDPIYQSTIYLR